MLSKLFSALALVVLPGAAFYGGYALTERMFRERLIPLPFEPSALTAGVGCFFWTLAFLVWWVFGKHKKNKGGPR